MAVVTGVGGYDRLSDTMEVKLMFQDGKEEVVAVENWDGDIEDAAGANSKKADVMVSYDVDKDEYTLTTLKDTEEIAGSSYTARVITNPTGLGYNKKQAAIVGKNNKYDIADDAMIVLKDGDDYVYMTGADLLTKNDIAFGDTYMAIDENEVGALFAVSKDSVTTGDTLYGYITDSYTALNADEDEVVYIDVIIDGEKRNDVETDLDENSLTNYGAGTVISYTMDGDVMCVEKESDVDEIGAIKEFNDARVLFYKADNISKTDRYLLTEDTVIIAMDGTGDDAAYAGDTLMAANAKEFDGGAVKAYYNNALYKANSDNEIEVIFVQVAADKEFSAS